MLFAGTLFAQDSTPVSEIFKTKLADMQSDDEGKVKNARQDWQKICFEAGAPTHLAGTPAQKNVVVKLMADALKNENLNESARFWLVRQLGRLDNGDNAELIATFVGDDRTVRDEAVWALANIPNEKAEKVLEKLLLLARKNDADKIIALENALKYRAQRKPVELPTLDDVLKSLENVDLKACQYVLPNMPWMTDAEAAKATNFKARFAKLQPEAKVLLADAMTARRDKRFKTFALEMTKDDNEAVKLAGYRTLGPLGDASVLPILMEKIREGGDLGETVRDSLSRLNFDGADKMLLDAYEKTTDNGTKVDLLKIFNRRKGTIAVPAFESGLNSPDEAIRRDSIRSLEDIGQQSSIPVLVDRYFAEEKKDFRDAIEKAIVQIECRYSDESGRGKAICTEIAKRNETEQAQLIPVLGKIGGKEVGEFVLEQYRNGKPAVKEAAFRSLCNWTDASVAEELYKVAMSNDSKASTAARAYIRIVTLNEHGRNDKEKLAYVEKAMSVSKTDDDRRFLLTRLDPSRCIEVFRFAMKYIDNPELEQAACKSVVDMANDTGFHMRYRTEIEPFLDKVIEKSKDNNHVERAKRYKARR